MELVGIEILWQMGARGRGGDAHCTFHTATTGLRSRSIVLLRYACVHRSFVSAPFSPAGRWKQCIKSFVCLFVLFLCMFNLLRHDILSSLQNHPSGHFGGCASRGRQRKYWKDNIKEWTSLPMPELVTMASGRNDWKMNSAESFEDESFLMCPPPSPRQPNRSRD